MLAIAAQPLRRPVATRPTLLRRLIASTPSPASPPRSATTLKQLSAVPSKSWSVLRRLPGARHKWPVVPPSNLSSCAQTVSKCRRFIVLSGGRRPRTTTRPSVFAMPAFKNSRRPRSRGDSLNRTRAAQFCCDARAAFSVKWWGVASTRGKALLGGAAAWVSPAGAQEPRKVIGILGSTSSSKRPPLSIPPRVSSCIHNSSPLCFGAFALIFVPSNAT